MLLDVLSSERRHSLGAKRCFTPHANPDSPVVYDGSVADAVTIVIGAVGCIVVCHYFAPFWDLVSG